MPVVQKSVLQEQPQPQLGLGDETVLQHKMQTGGVRETRQGKDAVMGCRKNPKKFWRFKWNGPHEIELIHISQFGAMSWAGYVVQYACDACKCVLGTVYFEEKELVNLGFNVDELHSVGSYGKDARLFSRAQPSKSFLSV